jgi:hypothetical protein
MSVADIPIDLSGWQFGVDPIKGYCLLSISTSQVVFNPICVGNTMAGNDPQSMAILCLSLAGSLAASKWISAYAAKYTKAPDQITTQQALNEIFKQLKPQMKTWKVCDATLWTTELLSKLPSIPGANLVMIQIAAKKAACQPIPEWLFILLIIILACISVKILTKLFA